MKASDRQETIAGMDRRSFCIGAGGAVALLGLGGGIKLAGARDLVRPPGGQDEERLMAMCVRCEKCLTVCPHSIIVPTHIEDGLLAIRTPQLSFDIEYCDWCADANNGTPLCALVCPTGALSLEDGALQVEHPIGTPYLNKDDCLAYRMTGCRFCYDACEFGAIELDDFNRPVIIPEKCVGCGACESVCVSLQNGSIREGAVERAIVIRPLGWEEGAS